MKNYYNPLTSYRTFAFRGAGHNRMVCTDLISKTTAKRVARLWEARKDFKGIEIAKCK